MATKNKSNSETLDFGQQPTFETNTNVQPESTNNKNEYDTHFDSGSKDGKKSKRIIKMNKWKALLIFTVIGAIIAGTTVGIYYALMPNPAPYISNVPDYSPAAAADEVESWSEENPNEGMWVYMGASNCVYCQYAVYGAQETEGSGWNSEIAGPFGEYASLENKLVYGIQIYYGDYNNNTKMVSEFFLEDVYIDGNEAAPEIKFMPENSTVYKIANPSLAHENAMGLYSDNTMKGLQEENLVTEVNYSVVDGGDGRWYISEDGTTPYGVTPAWFYFYDGELVLVVEGIVTGPEDGSTSTDETTMPITDNFFLMLEDDLADGGFEFEAP